MQICANYDSAFLAVAVSEVKNSPIPSPTCLPTIRKLGKSTPESNPPKSALLYVGRPDSGFRETPGVPKPNDPNKFGKNPPSVESGVAVVTFFIHGLPELTPPELTPPELTLGLNPGLKPELKPGLEKAKISPSKSAGLPEGLNPRFGFGADVDFGRNADAVTGRLVLKTRLLLGVVVKTRRVVVSGILSGILSGTADSSALGP